MLFDLLKAPAHYTFDWAVKDDTHYVDMNQYEARDGSKGTSVECEVDDVGPVLRNATAKVTRVSRGEGGFGGGNAASAPADDPWATPAPSGGGDGGWGAPAAEEPPFYSHSLGRIAMKPSNKAPLRKPKKKSNPLKAAKVEYIDYKDTALLRKFISDRGKIRARRVTGVTVQQQRQLAKAIKNAREMALLPYTSSAR